MNATLDTNDKTTESRGLSCRNCGCRHLPVVYTRPKPGGKVMRVRQHVRRNFSEDGCRHCARRMVTWEKG